MIEFDPHPLLDAAVFLTRFPFPVGQLPSPSWMARSLAADAQAPMQADDTVRAAVRDLLRYGGFKPTGRSKPASEYLQRAAADRSLGSINIAVDACNLVSLHSGLPISVVDLELLQPPMRIQIAAKGASYVFNASGQVIGLEGLVCLCDALGPCANAVKDAQRTKTHAGTTRTLSVIWGSRKLGDRSAVAMRWYREVLERAGALTEAV